MIITFLGTSHGVPEPNRKCTSVMLSIGENNYIFDAGVMLMSELKRMRVDLHSIKSIFVTHMHGDHTNGLIEFVDLLTWHDKDVRPEIWVPQANARDGMKAWLGVNHDDDLSDMPEFSVVSEGAFYDDGTIRVTAIRNRHLQNRPSYSYLIEAEGKRCVLTGDMGHDKYSDFPKCAIETHCDLVITEAAHCKLTECAAIFSKLDTPKLIVSHIVPFNEPEAEKLAGMMPYEVAVAFDGMKVTV